MNMKRLIQLLILLTLLICPIGANQFASAKTAPQLRGMFQTGPSISITVLPTLISLNETATATVSLEGVPSGRYTSAEFNCTYPAGMVQVGNIVVTGLFGPDPATAIYGPQNGVFIVGIAGSQGNKATSEGPAFTFRIKGLVTGSITIGCTARVSDGRNILTGIGTFTAELVAMEATITPTISPTSCDKAEFIADINVPPGTVMSSGTQFTKTWRLKNAGSCIWTNSYRIAFFGGEKMDAVSSAQLPINVAPGQMVDLSLNMTAPSMPGSYRGYWIFQNANGVLFGVGALGNQPWFVDIVAYNTTATPTPSLTQVESPTPTLTLTPTMGSLTGQVLAGKPVTLELSNADNWPVASILVNADGAFSLTAPVGTYNIVAHASGFLSAEGPVTVTGGSSSTKPTITLLAGDINGDSTINQFDALTIGMNYNASFPVAADLNNDGIINVLDLELLAKNYRKIGPIPW